MITVRGCIAGFIKSAIQQSAVSHRDITWHRHSLQPVNLLYTSRKMEGEQGCQGSSGVKSAMQLFVLYSSTGCQQGDKTSSACCDTATHIVTQKLLSITMQPNTWASTSTTACDDGVEHNMQPM